MSPKQMLKTMRLDKARELLKARKDNLRSVSEVCRAVVMGTQADFHVNTQNDLENHLPRR